MVEETGPRHALHHHWGVCPHDSKQPPPGTSRGGSTAPKEEIMNVEKIMTKNPDCCTPDSKLDEVAHDDRSRLRGIPGRGSRSKRVVAC